MATQRMPGFNISMFVGIGVALVAWRMAPGDGSWPQHWMLAALFAAGAVSIICSATARLYRARGPRPAPNTPPVWLILWATIVYGAVQFGTPHLRIVYGPQQCLYAGWNGVVRQGVSPCPLFEWIALP